MVEKIVVRNRKANYVDVIIICFFSLLVLISLVPLMNILSLSISDDYAAINNRGMIFPAFNHLSINAYKAVFNSSAIYTSFFVSVLVMIVATAIHLLVCLLAGFSLSDKKMPFRNGLMFFVLFTMLFGGGLIPSYLTMTRYGLKDTFAVMVLPGAVSGFSVILIKNYIIQIPGSLKESAQMDGANPFYILFKLIVPLSVPIIATLGLFCAVGKWNDWFTAYIYIKEKKWLWPFQNVLQNLVVNTDPSNSINIDLSQLGYAFKNALIVISLVPITIAYLFAQKYFIKGIFIGSVKE